VRELNPTAAPPEKGDAAPRKIGAS
jgi:hypothetical protein